MGKTSDWVITIRFRGKQSLAEELHEFLGRLIDLVPGVETVSMRKEPSE